jgi:hypothetical protein
MSNNSKISLGGPAGGVAAEIKDNAFQIAKNVELPKLINQIKNLGSNMFISLPEGLFVGAFLVGLLTHNMALLMLTGAMIVFRMVGTGLGSFLKGTLGAMIPLRGEGVVGACEPAAIMLSKLNSVNSDVRAAALPAQSLFFVVAVIFYSVSNIYKFKNELHALKRDDVLPVSGVFGLLIISLYVLWRMKSGCDSKEVILISVLVAAAVAYGVSAIFESLFGRQSINMLNLPLLVKEDIGVESVASCSAPNLNGV